ncbi:EAL domain-containing protein [Oceanithermus sp.]|uniref:EAL domain-containing protein n=1 Tax=Oceanithermus sp. TaxID=2268145 RepID=UPI0025FC5FCC|nr:EAL domain-containing protein [Oceanithermus sp.]
MGDKRLTLLIVALQEAFTATVPFFLLTSLVSVLRFLFAYFNLEILSVDAYRIWGLQQTLYRFSSFVATATIAYFLARRLNTSPLIATVLSIATLVTYLGVENPYPLLGLPYGFAPIALINPVVAVLFFKLFEPWLSLPLPEVGGRKHIYRHINHLFVYLAAYAATVVLFTVARFAYSNYAVVFLNHLVLNPPEVLRFAARDLFTQVFWFLGIHGSRTANSIFGKQLLDLQMFPNLTFAEFNRLFVVIGGAGVGLGLLLALWIRMRDRPLRLITYLSTPFVIFNINTLLIYAVVVLNRCLFLPFVGLPLLNFALAYAFLNLVEITFSDYYIVWNVPVFFDGYLKSGGDWRVLGFQGFLLALDTLVYLYFVDRYVRVQSTTTHLERLKLNLGLRSEITSQEGLQAFEAHQRVMHAHARLDAVVQDLKEENLTVYYQPKLPREPGGEPGLEALLRHRKDGRVRGPDFLGLIEDAGLAYLIDLWVCRRVKHDLEQMHAQGWTPRVSINLHPDTFLNDEAVTTIVRTLKGEDVIFEIVERSFFAGATALRNLQRLKEAGFAISIDDFGVGFSSLETIIHHDFYELKLDRSLTVTLKSERGYLVCQNIVEICHGIGSHVVAEGVEEPEQLERLCAMGVDYVQGYLFAPALPLDEALAYLNDHSSSVCV